MRIRAMELMALMISLLFTGYGRSAETSASPDEAAGMPEAAVRTQAAPPDAGEPIAPDDGIPPAARPERGPAALGIVQPSWTMSNSPLQGVIDLLRAGVEEEILLKHIERSADLFNVGSDEIVFLTDLGAPGHVISAMMDHDSKMQVGEPAGAAVPPEREPWPAAGTVAEVPAGAGFSQASTTLPGEQQEAVPIESPQGAITVDYFHDYLSPYGTWIDVPGYGLCWQPTVGVSAPGWKPYGDRGRWVYTDYGWYWYSDYSWGWAAFHYGRWFHHTRWGWCWAPGTVWGPSWVSWRYSDPYCGWAPLPPYSRSGFYFSVGISWGIPSWCYTYVPSYRICAYSPRRHAIPYGQAREIHGRSRVRDHYAVGRNHTIENRGIPPQELTKDTSRDIRRAQIRPREELSGGTVRRERLEKDGTILTVYQPRRSNRTGARPQTGSLTEPRTLIGDETASSRPNGTSINSTDSTVQRGSPLAGTSPASVSRNTTRQWPGRDEGASTPTRTTPTRSTQASVSTSAAGERAPTVSTRRSESPIPNRSVGRTDSDRSPQMTQPRTDPPSRTSTTVGPTSSLTIIGRPNSRQAPAPAATSQTPALNRSEPPSRSPSVASTRTLTDSTESTRGKMNSVTAPPSVRTWNSPAPRMEPSASRSRIQTRTAPTPTLNQSAPRASTRSSIVKSPTPLAPQRPSAAAPHYRAQPSRAIAAPSTSQQITPTRPPSTRPAPTVRSAPPARAGSVARPSPSYAAPRPTAPPPARSAPRSSPPSQSGQRSGGRSR